MSRQAIRILLDCIYVLIGLSIIVSAYEFYQHKTAPHEPSLLTKTKKMACLEVAKMQEKVFCSMYSGEMAFGYCQLDAKVSNPQNISASAVEECARVAGDWRRMNTSCGDACIEFANKNKCKRAATLACDCGPDRCWSHGTCVKNPLWYKKKDVWPYLVNCED